MSEFAVFDCGTGESTTRPLTPEEEAQQEADAGLDEAYAAESVRAERNTRLVGSDWTQLPDAPLTEAEAGEWAAYREALRNVDLNDPTWPDAPGGA